MNTGLLNKCCISDSEVPEQNGPLDQSDLGLHCTPIGGSFLVR